MNFSKIDLFLWNSANKIFSKFQLLLMYLLTYLDAWSWTYVPDLKVTKNRCHHGTKPRFSAISLWFLCHYCHNYWLRYSFIHFLSTKSPCCFCINHTSYNWQKLKYNEFQLFKEYLFCMTRVIRFIYWLWLFSNNRDMNIENE